MDTFKDFTADSKCWVFGFKNTPSIIEIENISKNVDAYLQTWKSHGKEILSSHSISENRFLIIVAKGSSGCSIDSMRKEISNILTNNNTELSEFADVFWKNNNTINCSDRNEFARIVKEKQESIDFVYDLSLSTLQSLNQNGLSKNYQDSWAAKAFA